MWENLAASLAALQSSGAFGGTGQGLGAPEPRPQPFLGRNAANVPAGYGYGYNPHTKRFRRPNPILRNEGMPPIATYAGPITQAPGSPPVGNYPSEGMALTAGAGAPALGLGSGKPFFKGF